MTGVPDPATEAIHRQRAIRERCVHPTGRFVPFERDALEQTVPDRFEAQARRAPGRVAVRTGAGGVTYGALDALADGVAAGLLARSGPAPEPVALLFDHGAPFVAAILGALKAGKFYVPLDPSYPEARLAHMLADAGAPVIVTGPEHLRVAGSLARDARQVVTVDELASGAAGPPDAPPRSPDRLAYVIYTSGSTGQPKGVMETHRNLLHKIMVSTNDYHLCADDARTLLYSPASSGSVWEIFVALLNGGSLHPFDARTRMPAMSAWLREEGITVLGTVPTLFRQLVGTLTGREGFPRLRLVNLGGEGASRQDVEAFRRHFDPAAILATTLATTEAGTICRFFVDHEIPLATHVVPAGYPAVDKEVLLLDERGEPVREGEVGEIVVKGRHLSPGYWGRPDWTAARFAPDPVDAGARRYRTGDLGRRLPDGCLLHVGRGDAQVKVRGHRVELAEVEMALLGLETVEEAAVALRGGDGGEPRLVAYVVPGDRSAVTASALRAALARLLPGHMVPSAFVVLDAMPLTPAGKLDRRALPDPGRSRPALDRPYTPPRTPVEQEVAAVWCEVLALDAVGVHDDFLDLGGQSIEATRILTRLIERFGIELPVTVLFESPTVADMAAAIARHQAAGARP